MLSLCATVGPALLVSHRTCSLTTAHSATTVGSYAGFRTAQVVMADASSEEGLNPAPKVPEVTTLKKITLDLKSRGDEADLAEQQRAFEARRLKKAGQAISTPAKPPEPKTRIKGIAPGTAEWKEMYGSK